jgi:hypothetical protein
MYIEVRRRIEFCTIKGWEWAECRVHFYRAGESDRGARVILCFLSHQICMIYSARFPGLAQVAEPRGVTGQGRHLLSTGYCLLMWGLVGSFLFGEPITCHQQSVGLFVMDT